MKPETAWYEFTRSKVKKALRHTALRNYKRGDTTTAGIARIGGMIAGEFQSSNEAVAAGQDSSGNGVVYRNTGGHFWLANTMSPALTSQALHAICDDGAAGSRRHFAVGGTTAPRSGTGTSTTTTTSSTFGTRTAILKAVEYGTVNGTITVVAGGSPQDNANGLVTTTAASTWATWTPVSVTGPDLATYTVRDLVYASSLGLWIMAVGDEAGGGGGIWTAPDSSLATWTERVTGIDFAALAWDGTTLHAVGLQIATNRYYTSTDGTSWAAQSNDGIQGTPQCIAVKDGFVAIGATGGRLALSAFGGANFTNMARLDGAASPSQINGVAFLEVNNTGVSSADSFCLHVGCEDGTSYCSARVPTDGIF